MDEEQLDLFPKKPYKLRNCPFCGNENMIYYTPSSIVCSGTQGNCHAIIQFMLCSTDTHTIRLFNQRANDEKPFKF